MRHTSVDLTSVRLYRLKLAPCRTEVDISLTDRLSALLNPAPPEPAHRVRTPNTEHVDVVSGPDGSVISETGLNRARSCLNPRSGRTERHFYALSPSGFRG